MLLEAYLDAIPHALLYCKDQSLNYQFFNNTNKERFDHSSKAQHKSQEEEEEEDRRIMETGEMIEKEERILIPTTSALAKEAQQKQVNRVHYPAGEEEKYYKTYKFPIRHPQTGEIMGVGGFSHDITRQRHLEKKLRDKEQIIESLFAASSTDLYLLNRSGHIVESSTFYRYKKNTKKKGCCEGYGEEEKVNCWEEEKNDEVLVEAEGSSGAFYKKEEKKEEEEEVQPERFDNIKKNNDNHCWEIPEILDCVQSEQIADVFTSGQPCSIEKLCDGGRWQEFRITPAALPETVLLEIFDITEKSTVKQKLNRLDEYTRALFQNMQLGMARHKIITDDDGKPVDYVTLQVNPAFEEITGMKSADLVDRKITSVFPGIEDDSANWIGRFGKVALEGTKDEYEQYSQHFDRWFAGHAYSPVKGEFVVLVLDVTRYRKNEAALIESEQKHSLVFSMMGQGLVYVDSKTSRIKALNQSAAKIMGMTPDELKGQLILDSKWDVVREDGLLFSLEELPYVIANTTGETCTGTVTGCMVNGTRLWFQVDAFPCLRPGETKPYQIILLFTDISESKRIEKTLLQAKEKAEEADGLKSSFIANISHEIRTPLNGIMGHIDLVLNNDLDVSHREENLEGLQIAKQSGSLLLSILNDILDLSKIEAGQLNVTHEPFSLRKITHNSLCLSQSMITQRGKQIKIDSVVDDRIFDIIYGDCWRLQQVLNNLLSNSVKFTDRGDIEIQIKKGDEPVLEFRVRDTGKGIPESHLESIFQPFRQVEFGDTRKYGGTGLGLTICKKLVELMGGELTVESTTDAKNHGTMFRFTFPYEPAQGDIVLSKEKDTEKPLVVPTKKLVGGKILVAEDDPVSRKMVKRMLERAGFEVIVAEDGREAVSAFESDAEIQLCLMDIQMPHMDGIDACKLIRAKESKAMCDQHIPIIALSAGAMKGDIATGLESGMTEYLTKPINYGLLLKAMTKYLGIEVDEADNAKDYHGRNNVKAAEAN